MTDLFETLDPLVLAIFAAVLCVVCFAAIGFSLVTGGADRRMKQRIARVKGDPVQPRRDRSNERHGSLRRDQSSGHMRQIDAVVRRFIPHPQQLRDRLERTGRKISIGQYALACVAVALAATLLRSLVFHMPLVLSILFGLVAGIGIPHLTVTFLIRKRLKRFVGQFPEAIDLIVRGLKSGLPTQESIRVVGQEFGDPIGVEFTRVSDSVKFGWTLEDALWDAAKRLDTPEFRFFCISLAVQRETGGNLAETLENLSDILRRRRQLHLKIKAMSSEAKASAIILGSLPFVMFALIFFVNRGYVMQLFQDPRGLIMVAGGLTILAVGALVMMKMVRFEV
jgi:tight adherence protein B